MRDCLFTGVIPALPTPFDSDEQVNHEAIAAFVERLVEVEGIDGLFVCGSTGEWWALSEEERRGVAEAAVKAVRGRVPVMIHVGTSSTGVSERLAQHAERIGADAISALPPVGRAFPAEAIWEHFRAIGAACGLPLYLYHLPQQYGDLITMDRFVAALETIPTLAGAKFSSYRIDNLIDLRTRTKGALNLISGCGEQLMSAIGAGADGSICTWYNLMPRLARKIIDCVEAGDVPGARTHEDLLVRAGKSMMGNGIGFVKRLAARSGIDLGQPRRPMPPLTDEQLAQGVARLEEAGVLSWII